jgi:hypothetical protein
MLGTTSFSQVSSEERWSITLSFRHSEDGGEFHRTAGLHKTTTQIILREAAFPERETAGTHPKHVSTQRPF